MPDQSGINALSGPLASTLCVLGVIVASRHRLKRWIAISQLLPPAEVAEVKVEPTPPKPVVKGWRWLFTKQGLKQIAFFCTWMGVHFFIIYGLPRISSRLFLDIFWGTVVSLLITFCVGTVSTVLVPDPSTVRYHRETPTSGLGIKTETIKPDPPYNWRNHTRTFIAVSTALATFISSYHGYTIFQPFVSAGWSTLMITGWGAPKMKTKRAVQVLLGVDIAVPVFTVILMVVLEYFGVDTDTPPNHPSRGVASPTPWILSILSLAVYGMPVVAPGILLAMTYRYEHARSHSSVRLRSAEPIPVPSTVPRFSAPIFKAGILVLGSTIAVAKVVSPHFEALPPSECLDLVLVLATIPVVILALAGEAWRQGVLREWWQYEEAWIPNKAEVAAMHEEHAEQAPSSLDEKASDEDDVEAGL